MPYEAARYRVTFTTPGGVTVSEEINADTPADALVRFTGNEFMRGAVKTEIDLIERYRDN